MSVSTITEKLWVDFKEIGKRMDHKKLTKFRKVRVKVGVGVSRQSSSQLMCKRKGKIEKPLTAQC